MVDAMPSRDEIIAMEKSYWEAMKAKDGPRIAALSGRKSVVTGPSGVRPLPQEKLAEMTEAGDWQLLAYELGDMEVLIPAPNVAVTAYTVRQTMLFRGEQREFKAADLSTWIRGEDGWQCHAHSESLLDDTL